jgi:acyl-CoA synthetase (AMP-forming)/AMP-acid ligase II
MSEPVTQDNVALPGLYEQVLAHAATQPDKVAISRRLSDGSFEETTYAQLARTATEYAHAFRNDGLSGAVIPMLMEKSADTVAAMLGTLATENAFAMLNMKFRTPQIEAVLEATQASVSLIDGHGLMAIRGGYQDSNTILQSRWWLRCGNSFEGMLERIATQFRESGNLVELSSPCNHQPLPRLDHDSRRVGCCLFTSGSTGKPKGVLISEADLRARVQAEIEWYEIDRDDKLLSILPFSFDVGLNQLCSALAAGCELVILNSWMPADIADTAGKRQITGISCVPTIWQDFINAKLSFDTTGKHKTLRYLTVSGGDLPRKHLEKLSDMAPGVGIFKTYGQTEAFRCTSLHPDDFSLKNRSVGQVFAGARIYIVRQDGSHANPGETGEIVHSGLGTMLGYIGGDDPQDKLRHNPFIGDDDGNPLAVFTGDLGYLDADDYLHLAGRRDQMIKISGNRIYPDEVSEQLLAIEGVLEAQTVALQTADGHKRLVAFVIIAQAFDLTPRTLQRQLSARVPSYMIPEEIAILTSLPRTSTGKPDIAELHRQAASLVDSG